MRARAAAMTTSGNHALATATAWWERGRGGEHDAGQGNGRPQHAGSRSRGNQSAPSCSRPRPDDIQIMRFPCRPGLVVLWCGTDCRGQGQAKNANSNPSGTTRPRHQSTFQPTAVAADTVHRGQQLITRRRQRPPSESPLTTVVAIGDDRLYENAGHATSHTELNNKIRRRLHACVLCCVSENVVVGTCVPWL